MLSLSKAFQRQWHSLYKAVERGTVDDEWLSRHLAQQVPQEGIQYFSLDGSAWPRPRARTMDDRQYVYHPTAAVNGGSICIGYPYSLLDWVPEAHRSWSLSVSVKRIPSQMTAGEMGIAQIKELSQNRADLQMYSILLLPMASMAMPNSYALYRVKAAALWCACVKTASYIGFPNSPRKENVGDPEYTGNVLCSRNQRLGKCQTKSAYLALNSTMRNDFMCWWIVIRWMLLS